MPMKKYRCRFYDPSYNYFKSCVRIITANDPLEAETELRRCNNVTQLVSIREIKPKN